MTETIGHDQPLIQDSSPLHLEAEREYPYSRLLRTFVRRLSAVDVVASGVLAAVIRARLRWRRALQERPREQGEPVQERGHFAVVIDVGSVVARWRGAALDKTMAQQEQAIGEPAHLIVAVGVTTSQVGPGVNTHGSRP